MKPIAGIIGGGVVGAHIALALASRFSVFLIEKNQKLGQETSTRNSGVLHAGIYYPQNSFKARFCVEGNALSREFFLKYDIPFKSTGKYIIARNTDEEAELELLFENATRNGVPTMQRLSLKKFKNEFPFINACAAIFSGSTGILDAGEYMRALSALLDRANVEVLKCCTARRITDGPIIETDRGDLEVDVAINAAGLYADDIAKSSGIHEYEIIPLKGDYLTTRSISLEVPIYPVPNRAHGTLGIHLTPTFSSEVLIGPTEVPGVQKNDYDIRTPVGVFYNSLASMIETSFISNIKLHEGYSGNRPRAYCNGKRCDDFIILENPAEVIHLIGIESPGLTSAPAIARYVESLLR
ncbi:MAG: FAD-dependent oxidoreductase [Spirochaetes bacterium]|nr:FAD-dependent oxidoreductase [Spirochaetota bacterium]